MRQLRIGLVGATGRPVAFLEAFAKSGRACLTAACDLNAQAMETALRDLPRTERYTDYATMLDQANLDAVIIGTPLPLHVAQSIAALERGISVYCEIPLGEDVEELKALRRAVRRSRGMFMAGENVVFLKSCMMVENLVKQGVFGEILYAESEYLHDCRELLEKTPWRRKCLFETSGLTYGTHCLGPVLRWFPGDRITQVSCVGTGREQGSALRGDSTTILLCRTARGRLIKIRMDLASPRPYALNFCLQGSRGAYQSSKGEEDEEVCQICVEKAGEKAVWQPLASMASDCLPELWQQDWAQGGGHHGGADTAAMIAFLDALWEGKPSPLDIDEGLDMTLPGIFSRRSIRQRGAWVDVPDPRTWEE